MLSQGVEAADLVVSSKGAVYFTSPAEQRVYLVDAKGARRVVFDGKKDGNILSSERSPPGTRRIAIGPG